MPFRVTEGERETVATAERGGETPGSQRDARSAPGAGTTGENAAPAPRSGEDADGPAATAGTGTTADGAVGAAEDPAADAATADPGTDETAEPAADAAAEEPAADGTADPATDETADPAAKGAEDSADGSEAAAAAADATAPEGEPRTDAAGASVEDEPDDSGPTDLTETPNSGADQSGSDESESDESSSDESSSDKSGSGSHENAAAPLVGPSAPRAGSAARPHRESSRWARVGLASRERRARILAGATAALGVAALAVVAFSAVAGTSAAALAAPDPAAAGAAPAALDGPPLLTGRVVDVPDPGTVLVDVQGVRVPVKVVGVDFSTTPSCAAADAMDFARTTLGGQRVTLVPDPSLPAPSADPTAVRRAYVVLPSQLSYTDAAISAGWALPGEGQYRAVFDQELATAQSDRAGMWGAPCRRAR